MNNQEYLEKFLNRLVSRLTYEYDSDYSERRTVDHYINERLDSIVDQLVAITYGDTLGNIRNHTHELHMYTNDYGEIERHDSHETQRMKSN